MSNKCYICSSPSFSSGVTCGSATCQWYLKLFWRKHKTIAKVSKFDNDVYMVASGSW